MTCERRITKAVSRGRRARAKSTTFLRLRKPTIQMSDLAHMTQQSTNYKQLETQIGLWEPSVSYKKLKRTNTLIWYLTKCHRIREDINSLLRRRLKLHSSKTSKNKLAMGEPVTHIWATRLQRLIQTVNTSIRCQIMVRTRNMGSKWISFQVARTRSMKSFRCSRKIQPMQPHSKPRSVSLRSRSRKAV